MAIISKTGLPDSVAKTGNHALEGSKIMPIPLWTKQYESGGCIP
jgi:hypothetical protein